MQCCDNYSYSYIKQLISLISIEFNLVLNSKYLEYKLFLFFKSVIVKGSMAVEDPRKVCT